MDFFIENGINWVIVIQNLGAWLELPMRFFTFLGSEEFFLIVLPVLYWSVDSALGFRVALMLVVTGGINDILKLGMAGPRPYWVSAQVKPFSAETSFGVPSGHAQVATGIWGTLAGNYKKTWGWVVACAVIFLIGFSRMYLGVHFPHDVLFGWILGIITLWAFSTFWGRVQSVITNMSMSGQILLAFGISLVFILLGYLMKTSQADFVMPADWITNARRSGAEPDPVSLNGIITTAATLFGIGAGAAWMNQYQASGSIKKRVLRYIIGLVGILIFWFLLGAIFPRGESLIPYIFRFMRYTLVGGWVTGGAPWLFQKIKLA